MLAGLSRWVREEAPVRLVPTRLRTWLERWTLAHAYPAAAAPLRWTTSADSSRAALLFGGDLALHQWRPGDTPGSLVSGLAALARTADALIVNLETQLTVRSAPAGTIGTFLRADPAATGVLSYLGVKAVTCANNHCLDYGPDGLRDSAERLEQAGIAVTGVTGDGRDGGAVVSVGGIRVGLLGFSDDWRVAEDAAIGPQPAPHDPALVRERITAMKSAADLVVVQLHWGYEWSMYPLLTLRNLARSYVESGASLVVCHHAHVPMGVETWRGGAIAHGLGNLYFGPERANHPFWDFSYVLRVEISSTGVVALEVLPVATDAGSRVGPDSGQSADTMRKVIAFLSRRLGHDDYLGRVEATITARHGCSVLRDLHSRVQAGDSAGIRERVRFLEPPRQRALLASLRAAGGGLARIGDVLEHLREGVVEPSASSTRAERAPERLGGAVPERLNSEGPDSVIPSWLRRLLSPLRPAVHALRSWLRMRRLRAGLRELNGVASEDQLDLALIDRIRTAWANTGWTGDAGFLREVAARVWRCPGPVLDCGSGLSTVILASVAARHGATVWSLEQDRSWYEHMDRMLRALAIDNVVLWFAPLRSYGDFLWFDLASRELPRHFPTVSCDGPAVKRRAGSPEQVAAWRSGVLPVLRELGVSFDEILLDDAEDPRSAGLIARWQRGGLETHLVATPTGTLIVARPSRLPGS